MYPKMFSNTKNLPQTETKPQKQQMSQQSYHHSQQQYSQERPFSEPYNPQDEFDFATLIYPHKYHFSLDPTNIFPKGTHTLSQENQPNQAEKQFESELNKMGMMEVPQVPQMKQVNWQQMEIVEQFSQQEDDSSFF